MERDCPPGGCLGWAATLGGARRRQPLDFWRELIREARVLLEKPRWGGIDGRMDRLRLARFKVEMKEV